MNRIMEKKKTEIVMKDNRLIEARYRLTLLEQQIVLYAISRCREEEKGLSADTPILIDVPAFARQFNIDERNAYHQVKEAMALLFERRFNFSEVDKTTGKIERGFSRWISEGSYIDGAGQVKFIFAPRVIPFITRLHGEETPYTSYRLEKIGNMTSAHAVRLYELLLQFLTAGKRTIELTWLKETLHLAEDYPRIFDLKKRVIDVAVKQINEHSDICVSYTQKKTGRTVTHLIFDIKAKTEEKTKPSTPKKATKRLTVDRDYVERHARPGESYDQAYRRLLEDAGQQRLAE